MKIQKKFRIVLVMTLALFIASCGSKQNQADQTDTTESTDSTKVDSVDTVVAEQYDLEAIAKAIEGCESLDKFWGGVARVTMKDERFYIDLQGRRVEKPKEEIDPMELTCDYEDGKFGYKDHEGNVVIPHKFHYAHEFSDGMAIVVNEVGEVGYINTKGELAIPYQYGTMAESDGNDFHEGLCAVLVNDEHEWFSYIDKTGKQAFQGVFSYAGDFSEGLAAVRTPGNSEESINSHSGYIDPSCGNKTTNSAASDTDSTVINEVPDTLNTVEAVVKQVNAVYAYWNELRGHYDENKPWIDDLFGSKEWQRVSNEVAAIDRECECGGFFDFGEEGPLNPWVYDCYEGTVSADSIQVKMQPDGTAEVRFLVKDAVTIKGVPMRWLMQVEDGQWKVANIFFENDDDFDILMNMRAYADNQ